MLLVLTGSTNGAILQLKGTSNIRRCMNNNYDPDPARELWRRLVEQNTYNVTRLSFEIPRERKVMEPPPTERHACKDCRHHRTAETLQHDWFNGIVKGNMHLCAANTVVSKAWNPIEGETECEAMSECRLYNRDGHCTQFEWREDIVELERLYRKRTPRRK